MATSQVRSFPVLGKLHIHQTLSEVPSKPGGRFSTGEIRSFRTGQGKKCIPLRDFHISHPMRKETHLPNLFMGYAGFSKELVGTTYYLYELAIFFSGFIAQVAPTAAFDHLQRLFPQFSGWLLCHGWTITPKKRSILGLTSLLSPSFTHSPSSNLHLFKNHLQVATKTTGRFTPKKTKDSLKIPRNIKVFKVAGHLSPLRPEIIFSEKHWIPKDPKQWKTMMLVSCLFRKVHGDVSFKHQGVTISY